MRLKILTLLYLTFALMPVYKLKAETYRNKLTVINGILTPKDVSEMVSTPISLRNEFLNGVTFNRYLFDICSIIKIEGELLYARHYGRQSFNEYCIFPMLRFPAFVKKKYYDVTFAAGDGLSYTPEIFYYENRKNRKSSHFINYLTFEFSFAFTGIPLSASLRLHHRSSAYGLILGGNTDSNFILLGLSYRFD